MRDHLWIIFLLVWGGRLITGVSNLLPVQETLGEAVWLLVDEQFAVDVLPALSMANIRLLLRATMPLPQLTPEAAVTLVIEHWANRARSRPSRLKRQRAIPCAYTPP